MLQHFNVGQKVKFIWREYVSEAPTADEHKKTRIQGSGRVVEFKKVGDHDILVVDTGTSVFDLPLNDGKHCYVQPLE